MSKHRSIAFGVLYAEALKALEKRYAAALNSPNGELDDLSKANLIRYLSPQKKLEYHSINCLFRRLCISSINRASWPGYLIDQEASDDETKTPQKLTWKLRELDEILCDFSPVEVLKKYDPKHPEGLYRDLVNLLPSLQGSKPLASFARTALDAAVFMKKFKSIADFCTYVDKTLKTKDANGRADVHGLPTEIAKNVHGIGYALACDFLKECGVEELGKPDVWLIKVMDELRIMPLRPETDRQKSTQNIIGEIATAAEVKPFAVDKVFWLLGADKAEICGTKLKGAKPNLEDFLTHFNKGDRKKYLLDWNDLPGPLVRAIYDDLADAPESFGRILGMDVSHNIVDSRLRQSFAPAMVKAILAWVKADATRRKADAKTEVDQTIRLIEESMSEFVLARAKSVIPPP